MQQKGRLAAVCGSALFCSDYLNLLYSFSASCGTFSNSRFDVSLLFYFKFSEQGLSVAFGRYFMLKMVFLLANYWKDLPFNI